MTKTLYLTNKKANKPLVSPKRTSSLNSVRSRLRLKVDRAVSSPMIALIKAIKALTHKKMMMEMNSMKFQRSKCK